MTTLRSMIGSGKARLVLAALIAGLVILSVPLVRAAPEQVADCPPSDPPTGCVEVTLAPVGLTADFYIAGEQRAAQVGQALIQLAPGTYTVDIRNIRSTEAGFAELFTYADTSISVTITAGQTEAVTVSLTRVYIRGTLRLVCNIRNVQPAESVACHVTIDGTARETDLAPGQTADYILDPGDHTLLVELTGANAALWTPASLQQTVTITAGQTATVRATFNKLGHLIARLNQPGVVGDYYLDGTLVASQVASIDRWIAAGSHRIDVRNLADPLAGGLYRWRDASARAYLASGQERTVTINLRREYLVGFLQVTCVIEGQLPSDAVVCNIAVDGVNYGTAPSGVQTQFNLTPGSHTVVVYLSGASASQWEGSQSRTVSITAGSTRRLTFTFHRLSTGGPGYNVHLSGVGPQLREVYQLGLSLGNNPNAFSKIGDSDTWKWQFLQPFDNNDYNLGSYGYLQVVLDRFRGSFNRTSIAAQPAYWADTLVDPFWTDPTTCNREDDETSLECEYRLNRPSVALIMVREGDVSVANETRYRSALRQIVDYSLRNGVIPVLTTVPRQYPPYPAAEPMNAIILQVAAEFQVPVWDLWASMETLPDFGVDNTSHVTIPPDNHSAYLYGEYLQYGMNRRNLEALEILHILMTQVMY